jgi:thiamine biosynthesis lipoprotein
MILALEVERRFECFGAEVAVHVGGPGPEGEPPEDAAERVRASLLDAHARLSRFLPDSELSALNGDPRETVPVGDLLLRFVTAAIEAAEITGGLVDPTVLDALERAGYDRSLRGVPGIHLTHALAARRGRRPAAPNPAADWRRIRVDSAARAVTRPSGVRLDSGGVGKGLAADLTAELLRGHATYAVDCAGDLRIGGSACAPRRVLVEDPFTGAPLDEVDVADGAVATSGLRRRIWAGRDGLPAHHLLDPSTGLPAFTGVVQATALAPTVTEAEALAKAALLAGPAEGPSWLAHGGVLVLDDGRARRVPAPSPHPMAA